jgi:hypothetical protein
MLVLVLVVRDIGGCDGDGSVHFDDVEMLGIRKACCCRMKKGKGEFESNSMAGKT